MAFHDLHMYTQFSLAHMSKFLEAFSVLKLLGMT